MKSESARALSELIQRDLDVLTKQISMYRAEEDLWMIRGDIANTAGNLCLHLTGNLRHFIGAILGGTGYVRDRHAEFNDRHIPRARLLEGVHTAKEEVDKTLGQLTDEQLSAEYPLEVFGYKMSTRYFLVHLYGHLNYHLGQINYHRRILTS